MFIFNFYVNIGNFDYYLCIVIKMERSKKLFNDFSKLMDKNIKGVKIGCYSVALIGLTVAMRRVRPFTKFKSPSTIPKRFIKDKVIMTGNVELIDPNSAVLLIDHKPLVNLFKTKGDYLPVKIAGIRVKDFAVNWLQTIVAGNNVTFIPIVKENCCITCQVTMSQETVNKKMQTTFREVNLGEALILANLATLDKVEQTLSIDADWHDYYNKLKLAERTVLKKRLGVKYYIKPTKIILGKINSQISNLVMKMARSVLNVTKQPVA